ncbi:DUF309 domain-containing protein, partial [Staphylococcus warneri]
IKGALKSYEKSLSVIKQAKDKTQLHLNIDEYQSMILHQINSIRDHHVFVPVKLPIHTSFEKVIKRVYQDYSFTQFVISEPY